jgi:hypothetical protein
MYITVALPPHLLRGFVWRWSGVCTSITCEMDYVHVCYSDICRRHIALMNRYPVTDFGLVWLNFYNLFFA